MIESANPRHCPLDSHAETRVRHRAVAAQIEIPLERRQRQAVLFNPLLQQFVRCNALRAADDLSISFRRQHIHAQREFRVLRVRLHVERLDGGGIAMNHHRPIELRGDIGLIGRAEIVAVLEFLLDLALRVGFLQHLRRFVIADARKRRTDRFQLRHIAANHLQIGAAIFQHPLDDVAQELFRQPHDVVEAGIRNLRLDHPELGQMTARLRFFGAKRGAERVDLAQRHGRAFDVELSALRQVGLVAKIFDGK